jgi:glutamine phosphoribosylpyrophosphate amidotransferase
MCGIFGTSDINRVNHFIDINKQRGSFAMGLLEVKQNYDIALYKSLIIERSKDLEDSSKYFLCHIRSPTSSGNKICGSNHIHPFVIDNEYLAHNGIIDNALELSKYIKNEYRGYCNSVDSSYILPLIKSVGLERCCELLEGTFACWYLKFEDGVPIVRIWRTGSVCSYSFVEFSSLTFNSSILLKENIIYKCNLSDRYSYFRPDIKYDNNSEFFI